MGPGQCALLCQRGLRTFLETATISYAPENAGDELRVVHVAESGKHLVLVAEVEVQPGIKGVAIFADRRRSREVRGKRPVDWRRIQVQQLDGVQVQAG